MKTWAKVAIPVAVILAANRLVRIPAGAAGGQSTY
jgi:hypothetical protein